MIPAPWSDWNLHDPRQKGDADNTFPIDGTDTEELEWFAVQAGRGTPEQRNRWEFCILGGRPIYRKKRGGKVSKGWISCWK